MKSLPIPLYDGYFAGEDGRIYKKNKKFFKQLSEFLQPYAKYLCVYLYNSKGDKVGIQVHKLIASAFFDADIKKVNIIHKDKNLFNNSPDNLIVSELLEQDSPDNDDEEAKCNIIKLYENLLLKNLNYDRNCNLWKKYKVIKSEKKKQSVYNWLYVNLKSVS